MANPRPSHQNGPPDYNNERPVSFGEPPAFTRPFTLYEAIPYTPFTSIVPFDSGVLPAPSIGSASPAPCLNDLIPSQDFETLNNEGRDQKLPSKRLQHTVNQFQHLIERGNITKFKFKTKPRTDGTSAVRPSPLASSLSPFSKMVYDQTSIPFRYPTPDTPNSSPPNGHQPAPVPFRNPALTKTASPVVPKAEPPKQLPKQSSSTPKNKQAHSHNAARLEIVLPTKRQLEQAASLVKSSASPGPDESVMMASIPQVSPQQPHRQIAAPSLPSPQLIKAREESVPVTPRRTPSQAPSGTQRAGIAIELPSAASFNKNEYLVVSEEIDEPVNLSARKRKRGDFGDEDMYGDSLDNRQRANTAFNELRQFLQHIYEAENHALASQSGNEVVILATDNEPTLTALAQTKVQTQLTRTIELNCFKNVPLEDLSRLLRLSEGALKQSESLEIKIEGSWGATDVEQWQQQLPSLETAIRAARTSLRIMCGGREDKQLYSEDTIEQCLNLFRRVLDGIVIPIAELRNSEHTAELFKLLSSNKKAIISLFTDCQKLFSLMSVLISKIDTSDTVTNTLEFAASRLIFMETAHTEKDSVLDTGKFDRLRLVAMDMLSQIFLQHPAQRQGIFDEILTSLEKLPLGKRARTFKLVDGTSIQPISALMMRLVQTSAGKIDDDRNSGRSQAIQSLEDGKDENSTENVEQLARVFTVRDEDQAATQHSTAIAELESIATPLIETARRNASYVINFIINRALKSTKSGDTPYRNLLDLFVEDFTLCLDNPDWPAAELLLRLLMGYMFKLVDNDKSGVPAKNMALELLGLIGAAISKLRGHVRKTASALDARDADDLGLYLTDLAASALELKSRPEQMVAWAGPYRATLEYLESRFSMDPHLASAISFIESEWGLKLCSSYESYTDDVRERDQEFGKVAYRLREMIQDRRWLSNEFSFKEVTPSQARLSYAITLLRSNLCESFGAVLNILLSSMASDQPTVRSKSLKSINQVLETDPSILDGDSVVIKLILQCSNDSSTQVRDSALGLMGKCIGMRPALENKMITTVVDRFIDTGPGVRKRAMKLAKDIYLRNNNKSVRSAIANGLLHRVQDPEESVRDLARQMIEEIWFAPFHNGGNSAVSQISLTDHVALMVQTVKQGNVSNVLDKVLQTLLAPESKAAKASLEVCTKLVASMFDLVDSPDPDDPSAPTGRDALQVLVIFAKADASLFTFEQLRLLKPHINSIANSEDLAVSRAVVVIYRRVLPQLSSAHSQFLMDVRKELMPTVGKVTRALLDDIVACLWIISTRLESSLHVARLTVSSLQQIQKLHTMAQKNPRAFDVNEIRRFDRYSLIVGMVGKHCQLDEHHEFFEESVRKWTGTSVSKLMVDVVVPFASPAYPLEARKAALDSVGLICQSSPRNYVQPNVYTTFQEVFDSQNAALEAMILRSFKEFLFTEEKRSEQAPEAPAANNVKGGEKKRELTVIGGTSYDDVASATTHRFLKEVIRIATTTQDDHAFLAVEVLASINRQGLVHPKETGVTFITLETSSNNRISELAYLEHKALHGKHETVVEREYVKALQSAFCYQRDIAKDARGATINPFTPKLHLMMEVLKISKSKNRQKFLEKLCGQIDFDVSKLEMSEELPPHVQYSRFIMENIAFLEYLTVGEVHTIVSAMEKLVTSTGATVAQAIESEIFEVRMDAIEPTANIEGQAQVNPNRPEVNIKKLRRLTAGSMILLALWEVRTYLRRLYNMGTNRRESKGKMQAKDLTRAPIKAQAVTGDKLWDEIATVMTALTSREHMMETCKAFVELMNVDKEFLVQDEDEEMNGEDPATPSNDEDEEADEPSAGRGRKRKALGTPGGRKKRARSSSQPRKRGRARKQSTENADDGELDDDWV
ncbi:sister chromatid cohesion C-terminus-domain-containing protein [Lasiosphaeris hirsuta]|uniref:Sister chromatid cohesion protein n=1 Tax=Lasiosphaeris hirsuta TaxID=260670 RepID=A0AA40AFP8_9PEZI|nr:sister chromatid cohesion C-terminus-domain-containing protein [Lasiosphaeris hirsuta]